MDFRLCLGAGTSNPQADQGLTVYSSTLKRKKKCCGGLTFYGKRMHNVKNTLK